jgi:3-hydroxy-D-aspartate aldolase
MGRGSAQLQFEKCLLLTLSQVERGTRLAQMGRQAIAQAADKAGPHPELSARNGIDCPAITGTGTGSFEFRGGERGLHGAAMRLVHFHGRDYGRNRDRDGEPTKAFEPSLFVWATVMSRPTEDRAIVDGLKALAFD